MFAKILIAGAIAALSQLAQAGVVLHSTSTTDTGSRGDFDVATMTFAATKADTLQLGNFGSGVFHDHSTSDWSRAEIELFNGSSWVNVFVSGNVGSSDVLLSTLFNAPIAFNEMMVSGIRLSSTQHVGQAFHFVNSAMTYTLSDDPTRGSNVVPEPASLALAGLGLLGIAAARRRRA